MMVLALTGRHVMQPLQNRDMPPSHLTMAHFPESVP